LAVEEASGNVKTIKWVYTFEPRMPLTITVGERLTFEYNDMHDVYAFLVSA
jgi:plastocyanin